MHVDFFIFFLSPMAINPQQKNQKEWLICQKGLQHFKDTFEFFFFLSHHSYSHIFKEHGPLWV